MDAWQTGPAGRHEPPTQAFLDRLVPIGAYLSTGPEHVRRLRDRPAGEPPWPQPGNPVLARLVARGVEECAAGDRGTAVLDVAVHSWREGGLAWARATLGAPLHPDDLAYPGSPPEMVEAAAARCLATEPDPVRELRLVPEGPPWPSDGNPMLELLVVQAAERLQDGLDPTDVLLSLAAECWREGGVARAGETSWGAPG